MRLIDADDLVAKIMVDAPDFMDGGSSITKAFIMAMLGTRNATPTIDAVPVVRCNDCKHGSLYCTEDVLGETLIECNRPDLGDVVEIHGWKWFCADGEKKERINE